MSTTFSLKLRWCWVVLLVLVMFGAASVVAEPYLAFKTGNDCSACHVNPTGGGARTTYGSYYGAQALPANPASQEIMDGGQITQNLRVGTNFRFDFSFLNQNGGSDDRTFNTESGQVYVAFQPRGSRFTAYFDQQVVPGGSRNREAFALARLNPNHYLKAGKFIVPYGIKLQDDDAFIRQATQVNFDASDNGIEWGFNYDKLFWRFAVTNGTGAQTNDDEQFQYVGRAEYIGNNWRLGSSFLFNDAEAGERQMFNVFGGLNLAGYVFLFETNRVDDSSISNLPGEDVVQVASLFEVNKAIADGVNLKVTTEYLDPDDKIDENERTRNSLLLEYTPYAYMQVRGGVRVGDDIPQRAEGNYTEVLVQLHFYY